MIGREQRDRSPEHIGLKKRSDVVNLLDLIKREARNDCATISLERHETFSLKMTQGLADWNGTNSELRREDFLSYLRAFGQFASEDPFPDCFECSDCNGLCFQTAARRH